MKKVLLVATVQSHIAQFHKPLINMLNSNGYQVDIAARDNLKEKNGLNIEGVTQIYDIQFSRSPIDKNNIKAYRQLKEIILQNEYDIIHCNTPMGGIITRLIKRNKKIKAKIIYTAHGFHFYKGAPILNWIIYYPIEKFFSRYTDIIITINNEDYQIARNKFKAKYVYKINSTGININKFKIKLSDEEKNELKNNLNITNDDFVIVCIGELNKNKNQIMQIQAMKKLVEKYKNIKLLFLGNGPLKDYYVNVIKENKLQNNVFLLGYRTDVNKILNIADCAISTSVREGLGLNILEAMSAGVPTIASDNRGHREIISDKENGFLIELGNVDKLVQRITELIVDKRSAKRLIENANNTIKKFSEDLVVEELKNIYKQVEPHN